MLGLIRGSPALAQTLKGQGQMGGILLSFWPPCTTFFSVGLPLIFVLFSDSSSPYTLAGKALGWGRSCTAPTPYSVFLLDTLKDQPFRCADELRNETIESQITWTFFHQKNVVMGLLAIIPAFVVSLDATHFNSMRMEAWRSFAQWMWPLSLS